MQADIDISSHNPVLLQEMLQALNPKAGGIYVDGTFGAGGYSKAILDSSNCSVVAIDQDMTVLQHVTQLKNQYPGRFQFIQGNFANMSQLLANAGYKKVDGVVLDIGVSSMQLDTPERGFSFAKDGPLDMRMNREQGATAADIIATAGENELADILYMYGGERKSRQIARAIVQARQEAPITTTLQLAKIISTAVHHYRDQIHPATRSFQALRIIVNGELMALEQGLKEAVAFLAPLGRLVIVTFHSLEDSIVKRYFGELCGSKLHINKYRDFGHNQSAYRHITKGVVTASREEMLRNPRSRSAKLRAIERLQ